MASPTRIISPIYHMNTDDKHAYTTCRTTRDYCKAAGLRQAATPWTRHTPLDEPSVTISPSDFPTDTHEIAQEQELEHMQYMGRKMYSPLTYRILSFTGLLTGYYKSSLLTAYQDELSSDYNTS